MIIKALDSADIDKSSFILRSIIAQFDRKCNGTALKLYTKSLYNLIWEEAYFSPEEKLTLFASLAHTMGVNFISFFNDLLSTRSELLKILKPIDQEFLELLFCELINIFCFMGSDEKTKFNFFREIYRSYSYADFDVLDLFKNKIRKNERDEIQKWYSSESVVDSFLSSIFSIDLSILHFFNENEFIPILCRKVKEVLTNKYSVSLVELNSLLRDLDELKYKDQFLKELFEKKKKTVKLMEDYFLEDMKTYLSIKNDPELISLASQLIPEWKKHFISWVKNHIKDVKKRLMTYTDKPSYYEEIELFKSLEKINRLDDFIISLKSDASDDFIRDIEEVLKQYSDSRKN
ncbi:MAG: hypothetical protein VX777_04000 [Chlamydiota bacterium]|nr:hypothetical protein [Chlamydiota bacterium]